MGPGNPRHPPAAAMSAPRVPDHGGNIAVGTLRALNAIEYETTTPAARAYVTCIRGSSISYLGEVGRLRGPVFNLGYSSRASAAT